MRIEIDSELYEQLKDKIVVREEEDIEEDEEEEETPKQLPTICYEIKLYKNTNSQTLRDKPVYANGSNLHVAAINETASVMYVLNENGQAVYSVAWELVAEVVGLEPIE